MCASLIDERSIVLPGIFVAAACAEKFGYRLEEFRANERLSFEWVDRILHARGIRGLLIPPGPLPADFFWAQTSMLDGALQWIPPLSFDHLPQSEPDEHERRFHAWLRETRPDAILTEGPDLVDQLKRGGYRVPEDVALAVTSVQDGDADAGSTKTRRKLSTSACSSRYPSSTKAPWGSRRFAERS